MTTPSGGTKGLAQGSSRTVMSGFRTTDTFTSRSVFTLPPFTLGA
ncbi:hypothetical protein [Neisseria cinerea]|nr:hypothetical protein [Neisseria cinerea]